MSTKANPYDVDAIMRTQALHDLAHVLAGVAVVPPDRENRQRYDAAGYSETRRGFW